MPPRAAARTLASRGASEAEGQSRGHHDDGILLLDKGRGFNFAESFQVPLCHFVSTLTARIQSHSVHASLPRAQEGVRASARHLDDIPLLSGRQRRKEMGMTVQSSGRVDGRSPTSRRLLLFGKPCLAMLVSPQGIRIALLVEEEGMTGRMATEHTGDLFMRDIAKDVRGWQIDAGGVRVRGGELA